MRIGPLEISRGRDYVEYAAVPYDRPGSDEVTPGQTVGTDGDSPFGLMQLLADDNPDLQVPNRFFVYNKMRKEDPAVRSALWLYKLPIRSADWTLTPASDDPIDGVIADAIAWNFGLNGEDSLLDLTWDEQIQQGLLKLDFGSMGEEIIWGESREWEDADGDVHLLIPVQRLAPRFPSSVMTPNGFVTDTMTGLLSSVTQMTATGPKTIPGEKLIWHTQEKEGNDWYGTAMLRPMYGSWRMKRAVTIAAGIGWDRFAYGTPVVRYPIGGGPNKKREADEIGRNYRTHERGWVTLEGPANDPQGWDIEIKTANINDPVPLVNMYDAQIAMSAMEHFSVLGRTQTGNRAIGEVLAEPFYLGLQTTADSEAAVKMRFLFRKFVDVNFGSEFSTPSLIVSGIASRDLLQYAQALEALAAAGLTFTDPETVNDIREQFDIRQLTPETIAALQQLPPDAGVMALPGSSAVKALPVGARPQPQHTITEGVGLGL